MRLVASVHGKYRAVKEALGFFGFSLASPEVRAYVASICAATRNSQYLTLGASTRAAIALIRAGQGNALLCGRDYIIPEDIQRMAAPVLCHRFVLSADARMRGMSEAQVLSELLAGVRIPVRLK